jgi:hypothetical protein
MKSLTIPNGVAARPLTQDGVLFWANKEVNPMLTSLRTAANYETRVKVSGLTTQTGTAQWVWRSEQMPYNGAWLVKADVVAMGATSRAVFELSAAFESTGGTASFAGETTFVRHSSSTSTLAQFTISSNVVSLDVTDDGSPMTFNAVVDVLEVKR